MIATLDVMEAIRLILVGLTVPGSAPAVALFDRVALYQQPDLLRAIRDLRVYKDRAAFVVPVGGQFLHEVRGAELRVQSVREVVILVSDRDYVRATDALTGDAEHLGVLGMKDLVLDALMGETLGFKSLCCVPHEEELLTLSEQQSESAGGRVAWALSFRVLGDWMSKRRAI